MALQLLLGLQAEDTFILIVEKRSQLTDVRASLAAQLVKNLPAMWESWIGTGLGRSPGGGHDNPLQYSCMKNPHGQRSLMSYRSWGHKEVGHD